MSDGHDEQGSSINIATVLMSAGIAAVVSALIVTIGVVGMVFARNDSPPSAQPAVVNLGSAQMPTAGNAASAAPAQSSAPAGAAQPGAAPQAAAPQAAAPTAAGTPVPAQTPAPTVTDAAPQDQTPSLNAARADYLYVRSDTPTARTMEWQFAAMWNPRTPIGPKLAVSYRGDIAKVREQLSRVMQSSQMYDFFSIRGSAVGQPQISGNQMVVTYRGLMAGFPVQTSRYHYVREGGLWKFDWKKICQELQCQGNPDFGY